MKVRRLGGPDGPPFDVVLDPNAKKELDALQPAMRRRMARAFEGLRVDPLNPRPGLDIKPLRGYRRVYRLRVGLFRSCYFVVTEAREVRILLIMKRGDGYGAIVRTVDERFRDES